MDLGTHWSLTLITKYLWYWLDRAWKGLSIHAIRLGFASNSSEICVFQVCMGITVKKMVKSVRVKLEGLVSQSDKIFYRWMGGQTDSTFQELSESAIRFSWACQNRDDLILDQDWIADRSHATFMIRHILIKDCNWQDQHINAIRSENKWNDTEINAEFVK